MKLARDLVVLAVLFLGVYGWLHRRLPKPKPLIKGRAPTLAMPAAPETAPRRTEYGGAMLVEKESLGVKKVPLKGSTRFTKPPPQIPVLEGDTPDLLADRVAPSLDDPTATTPEPEPTWLDRVSTPQGMASVFALFVLCYLILGRALRKGPGGHGFTHD